MQSFGRDDNDENQDSLTFTPEFIHPTPANKSKKKVDNENDMLNKTFDILDSSAATTVINEDENRSYGIYTYREQTTSV